MLKAFVIAAAIGGVSILMIEYAAVLAIGLIAQNGEWESFMIQLGSIEFFGHLREESSFETSAGEGLFYLAVLGGLLNGLGAMYFSSRRSQLTGQDQLSG